MFEIRGTELYPGLTFQTQMEVKLFLKLYVMHFY